MKWVAWRSEVIRDTIVVSAHGRRPAKQVDIDAENNSTHRAEMRKQKDADRKSEAFDPEKDKGQNTNNQHCDGAASKHVLAPLHPERHYDGNTHNLKHSANHQSPNHAPNDQVPLHAHDERAVLDRSHGREERDIAARACEFWGRRRSGQSVKVETRPAAASIPICVLGGLLDVGVGTHFKFIGRARGAMRMRFVCSCCRRWCLIGARLGVQVRGGRLMMYLSTISMPSTSSRRRTAAAKRDAG